MRVCSTASLTVVVAALATVTVGCSTSDSSTLGTGTSNATTPACWDGSQPASSECPELQGLTAMQWVLPKRKSGVEATCTKNSPSNYSPAPKSVEIVNCTWPDQSGSVTIERYPDPQTAHAPLSDPWLVDGKPYGDTLYTAASMSDDSSSAERWWSYADSPIVIELIGTKAMVDSLPDDLAFRTPEEVRSGQAG